MCIVPIFRYSAPLVPWTVAELFAIDKLWSRAVKFSLRLPMSFDLAPILLSPQYGSMGLEPAASFVLKETQIHLKQCLSLNDDVNDLVKTSTLETMELLGLAEARDAIKVESLMAKRILHRTPAFRQAVLLSPTYWGSLHWMLRNTAYGKLLATVVQEWKTAQAGVHPQQPVPGPSIRRASTVDKVMRSLHSARIFTVQQLIAGSGWDLKQYSMLPKPVTKLFRAVEYYVFKECLHGNPGASALIQRRKPDIKMLLYQAASVASANHHSPRSRPVQFPLSCFEQVEGFMWAPSDLDGHDLVHVGEAVCKYFPREAPASGTTLF